MCAFIISISQMKKLRLSGACSLLKITVSKTPSLELGSYVSAPRACIELTAQQKQIFCKNFLILRILIHQLPTDVLCHDLGVLGRKPDMRVVIMAVTVMIVAAVIMFFFRADRFNA